MVHKCKPHRWGSWENRKVCLHPADEVLGSQSDNVTSEFTNANLVKVGMSLLKKGKYLIDVILTTSTTKYYIN